MIFTIDINRFSLIGDEVHVEAGWALKLFDIPMTHAFYQLADSTITLNEFDSLTRPEDSNSNIGGWEPDMQSGRLLQVLRNPQPGYYVVGSAASTAMIAADSFGYINRAIFALRQQDVYANDIVRLSSTNPAEMINGNLLSRIWNIVNENPRLGRREAVKRIAFSIDETNRQSFIVMFITPENMIDAINISTGWFAEDES